MPAAIPSWLLGVVREQKAAPTQPEKSIPEGRRNSTLASLGGVMRSRGMTGQAIEAALLADNRLRCDPPLPEAEVRGIARSIGRYAPSDAEMLSAHIEHEEGAERILRFRSGAEIEKETLRTGDYDMHGLIVYGVCIGFWHRLFLYS